jgi:biopolymer transport protein ExbD/biopolymer transport protein TolR
MAMSGGNGETGGGKVIADINVTPMVDVMLVLLIIFMVVTPLLQKGQSVDMAKTKYPREMKEADRDDAIIVAVTRDGKLFLHDELLSKDKLNERIKDLLQNRMDKTVYVRSDRRAKYGEVVDVVDIVRASGVDALGLLPRETDLPFAQAQLYTNFDYMWRYTYNLRGLYETPAQAANARVRPVASAPIARAGARAGNPAGRRLGRGLDHFRKEGAKLVPPPTADDPYENEAYRLWAVKQRSK